MTARDFGSNESLETQEYFVYFKFSNCTVGAKDLSSAAAEQISGYRINKIRHSLQFRRLP